MKDEGFNVNRQLRVFAFMKTLVPILIGIYLFFNPFPHTTTIKEICFYGALSMTLLLAINRDTDFSFRTPLSIPLGFYTFWALVSIFFAVNKGNSLHDYRAHLLKYMVFFFLLYNFFSTRKRLEILSKIIMISTTVASTAGLWYFYIKLETPFGRRFNNPFGEIHLNQIGILLVFAINLYLRHLRHSRHLWHGIVMTLLICPNVIATVMMQTRSAVFALFVTILVQFMDRKRTMAALLIGLTGIVALSPGKQRFFRTELNTVRLRQHLVSIQVIKDYPLTGIGFGLRPYGKTLDLKAYIQRLPEQLQDEKYLTIPHSMLMHIGVSVGVVGLFLFLWVIFVFIKICWANGLRSKDKFIRNWGRCILSAFLGFFVIGVFEPIFFHSGEVVLFTIFAMAAIVWRLNNACRITHMQV